MHQRVKVNLLGRCMLEDRREFTCQVIDMSPGGAAIQVDPKPAVGTPVSLGMMRGRVVRRFDEGVAIEFAVVHSSETLQSYFA